MEKSKKSKLLIVLVMAILCVALTLLLIINSRTNGHYVAKEYEEMGVTFYIDLEGSKYEMVATSRNLDGSLSENRSSGSFKIKDDLIIVEFEGSELTGSYNKKEHTITLNGIIFSKE